MSKNIIITGTSSGIGFELVKIFSKDNNRVLALSRNNSKLRDLKLDGVDAIDFDINNPDEFRLSEFLNSVKGFGIHLFLLWQITSQRSPDLPFFDRNLILDLFYQLSAL